MKIKTNTNLTSGIVFLLISSILYLLIPSQIQTYEKSEINAQTIPTLIISMIFIFALLLTISGLRQPKTLFVINGDTFKTKAFKRELKTLWFIAMLFIYALIFEFAGFIISSILLSSGVLIYYKSKKWYFYVIALSNVIFIFVVFELLLNVNLP